MAGFKNIFGMLNNPKIFYRKFLHRFPSKKARNWILGFPSRNEIGKQVRLILNNNEGRPIIIFPPPSCPWGYMFQRPQQLARAFAEEGFIVFYLVDTSFPYEPDWHVRGLDEIEQRIVLFNDGCDGDVLISALMRESCYIWQYWPHQYSFVEKFFLNKVLIYDCIDHLSTFTSYDGIKEDFRASLEQADLIIATSKKIEQDLLDLGKTCTVIPNGVYIKDFQKVSNVVWEELDEIKQNYEKIVGYYGAIAPWFDFETVEYCAKENLHLAFLIVGEVYPEIRSKIKQLKKLKNIIFLPRVAYSKIPDLLSYFDVAMLPFIINDITLSTSPVKVYEYMAGNKITVSTDLPEVRNYPSVFIGSNKNEFNLQLKGAILKSDDPEMHNITRETAAANTWGNRIEKVLCKIHEGKNKK